MRVFLRLFVQYQKAVSINVHVSQWLSRYLEGAHEGFVNTHHATCIVKLSAVVWSREKCDQLAFGKELVSILHNLLEDT